MTNCNQIANESARLKTVFKNCYNLKSIDLRAVVDLIESVSACAGGEFNIKTINGQSVLGIGNIEITATSDGTDTKVQSGTGKISIIGNGSVLNPYTVSNTTDGSETLITQGTAITITGSGTTLNPYIVNAVIPAKLLKTSELVNDGANGTNPFATLTLVNGKSLQDVINVNKVADRVEFRYNKQKGGLLTGSFIYFTSSKANTIDLTQTYIYGAYSTYDGLTSVNLSRVNADLSEDRTFNTGTGFVGAPYAGCEVLVADDGTVYVTGLFSSYNGTPANNIISINPNGTVNTTFNYGSGFNNFTTGLAFNVAKTHIYVGGIFATYKGIANSRIVKLTLAGVPDPTFILGSSFDNTVVDLLVDPDDKIFVLGYFNNYRGVSSPKIAKLLPNGDRDASFNVGTGFNTTGTQPNYIKRDSLGRLIVYGTFTTYNGVAAGRIAALNEDGTINSSIFGTGVDGILQNVHILPDGKILISGAFTTYNGIASIDGLVILNADYSIYKTFNAGIKYFNILQGYKNTYISLKIGQGDQQTQLVNFNDGVLRTEDKLTFSNTTGKAEYTTGSLGEIVEDEIMPRRLIEQLIYSSSPVRKTTSPLLPKEGDVYYDLVLKKLRCWNGTIWNNLF
jgi:hypothetical protein